MEKEASMKYIKRRSTRRTIQLAVTAVLSVILVPLLLTGCTKNKEAAGKEIHFVTWKPNIPGVQEDIIKYFEIEHPAIEIKREALAASGEIDSIISMTHKTDQQ